MSGHQRQTWLVRTQTAATLLLLGFPIPQSPALLSLEGARFGTQEKQELKTETKGWMDGSFGYVGVVVADWIASRSDGRFCWRTGGGGED